jgi:hypothetical protein
MVPFTVAGRGLAALVLGAVSACRVVFGVMVRPATTGVVARTTRIDRIEKRRMADLQNYFARAGRGTFLFLGEDCCCCV